MFSNIINKFRPICCHDGKSNHVACLVKGRTKLVSSCLNDYRRQYVCRSFTTTLHAEVGCIKDLKKIKKNLTMLILRYRKDGVLCDSRPCLECKNFLISKGFNFVFCSVADGTIQKIILKNLPNYLSISQIQFKIIGYKPLNRYHFKKLLDLNICIEELQKMNSKMFKKNIQSLRQC